MIARKIACALLAGSLAASVFSPPVLADNHKNGEAVAAVAGIVALGILGAALAEHQHDEGYEEYRDHPRFHPDENAVGKCMHRAKRILKDRGAHHIKLKKVDKLESNGRRTVVNFHVVDRVRGEKERHRVHCVLRDGKIAKFEI